MFHVMCLRPLILPAILAGLSMLPVSAAAQSGKGFDVVAVEVLPGWRLSGGSHMAGLRISLAPGWKTYWRTPGEGGIPPQMDLGASGNLGSIATHFPRPEVLEQNGLVSIGYTGEVVFPIEVTPRSPGEPIHLKGSLEIGVCEDICIPMDIKLDAVLPPAGTGRDSRIEAALSAQPELHASKVTCSLEPISDGMRMTASIPVAKAAGELAIVEMRDPRIWVSTAKLERTGGTLSATVDMVPPTGQPFAVDRSTIRFTVVSKDAAIEMNGCKPS